MREEIPSSSTVFTPEILAASMVGAAGGGPGLKAADQAAVGLALLTTKVRCELVRHIRVYADGLVKFEPNELSRILVPTVSPRLDALDVFERATALLLAGHGRAAEALADEWVAQPGKVPASSKRRGVTLSLGGYALRPSGSLV